MDVCQLAGPPIIHKDAHGRPTPPAVLLGVERASRGARDFHCYLHAMTGTQSADDGAHLAIEVLEAPLLPDAMDHDDADVFRLSHWVNSAGFAPDNIS